MAQDRFGEDETGRFGLVRFLATNPVAKPVGKVTRDPRLGRPKSRDYFPSASTDIPTKRKKAFELASGMAGHSSSKASKASRVGYTTH